MAFLAFLYPFPYAAKASPTSNPTLLSIFRASLLTPPQEGRGVGGGYKSFGTPLPPRTKGSGSHSGLALLASPKDTYPCKLGIQPVCHGDAVHFGWSGFYVLYPVQRNVAPGTNVRSWLASPSAHYHLVLGRGVWGPPSPPFIHVSLFRG